MEQLCSLLLATWIDFIFLVLILYAFTSGPTPGVLWKLEMPFPMPWPWPLTLLQWVHLPSPSFFPLINPQTIYLNWRAPVKPNPDQQSFKHGPPWPTLNLSSHWVPWAGWQPFKPCLISDKEMIELDTKKRVLPLPIKEKNQINQNTCSLPTIPSLLINFI